MGKTGSGIKCPRGQIVNLFGHPAKLFLRSISMSNLICWLCLDVMA